jgi:hypothetical protein
MREDARWKRAPPCPLPPAPCPLPPAPCPLPFLQNFLFRTPNTIIACWPRRPCQPLGRDRCPSIVAAHFFGSMLQCLHQSGTEENDEGEAEKEQGKAELDGEGVLSLEVD